MARLALLLVATAAIVAGVFAQSDTAALGAMDFGQIIAGPLQAAIKAQTKSANKAIDFIQTVGFETSTTGAAPKPRTLKFGYSTVDDAGVNQNGKLEIPLLALVHVPFVRIDKMSIDFNARISSTDTESTTTTANPADAKAGTTKGSIATKQTSVSGDTTQRDFSMRISATFIAADLPEGAKKMMDRLLDLTVSTPASA